MSSPPSELTTRTQRVRLFTEADPLVLELGATLGPVDVAYEAYGDPAAPPVVLCHALTGDAHATGVDAETGARGWWEQLVGPGRPVDTDERFVVCANLLGGCRGTTGPLSTDPATGRAYGSRFPHLTLRDLVAVHRALVAHLGLGRVDVVGGSLGGMQALQWALDFPEEVGRIVLVCATSRLSAENLAFSDVAREALLTDPDFQGGDYPGTGRRPDRGMALARRLGHITYVSEEVLERKFGRRRRDPSKPVGFGADFEVEHYLDHQAAIFLERFDALTYLHLLRPMDHFDPFADPALDLARVRAAGVRALCVSFDSDWRFGPAHSERIAAELTAGGVDAVHHVVRSPHGHDSFLLDVPEYHGHVRSFLA